MGRDDDHDGGDNLCEKKEKIVTRSSPWGNMYIETTYLRRRRRKTWKFFCFDGMACDVKTKIVLMDFLYWGALNPYKLTIHWLKWIHSIQVDCSQHSKYINRSFFFFFSLFKILFLADWTCVFFLLLLEVDNDDEYDGKKGDTTRRDRRKDLKSTQQEQ